MDERHKEVRELLTTASNKLDRLGESLLRKETLGQEALEEILGARLDEPTPTGESMLGLGHGPRHS